MVNGGKEAVALQVFKVIKAMLSTYTGPQDVATPSGAMSEELVELLTFRQGGKPGLFRTSG